MCTMGHHSAIKQEWNIAICSNMDGLGGYNAKQNNSEKDKYSIISLIYEIKYTTAI